LATTSPLIPLPWQGLVIPVLTFDWLGSVCKVRTQDPENFDEEVKSLVTAWRSMAAEAFGSYDLLIYKFSFIAMAMNSLPIALSCMRLADREFWASPCHHTPLDSPLVLFFVALARENEVSRGVRE
jgi:hypothetical protein